MIFIVSTSGGSSATVRAYNPEDAARNACDQLWDESAGEAFDVNGDPTELIVVDEAGIVTKWRATAESMITYWVQKGS